MGLLTIQKLYCLIEIIHSDLFTQHGEWNPEYREDVTLFIVYRLSLLNSLLHANRSGGCSQLKQLHYKTGRFSPYKRMVIDIWWSNRSLKDEGENLVVGNLGVPKPYDNQRTL